MSIGKVCASFVLLVLVGCASSAPPAAQAPAPAAAASSDPYAEARASEAMALRTAQAENEKRAGEWRAQEAAQAAMVADGQARIEARDREAAEAHRNACESTRAERVADAQRYAAAHVAFIKRVAPHAKAIKASCRITTSPTGAVRFDRSRAYAEQQEGVACKGGNPGGLSTADVYVALHFGESVDLMVASDTEYAEANRKCRDLDMAAGFDWEVKNSDAAGMSRLLAWKR